MRGFHLAMFLATFVSLVVAATTIGLYDSKYPDTVALYWVGVGFF